MAIADYTDAIRLNPKDAKTYSKRGHVRAERATLTEPSRTTHRPFTWNRNMPRPTTAGVLLAIRMATWMEPWLIGRKPSNSPPNLLMLTTTGALRAPTRAIWMERSLILQRPSVLILNTRKHTTTAAMPAFRRSDLDGAIADWTQAIQLAPN